RFLSLMASLLRWVGSTLSRRLDQSFRLGGSMQLSRPWSAQQQVWEFRGISSKCRMYLSIKKYHFIKRCKKNIGVSKIPQLHRKARSKAEKKRPIQKEHRATPKIMVFRRER
ncbi:hypothetical protein FOZ62_004988, partial [Perkinsus olseni]